MWIMQKLSILYPGLIMVYFATSGKLRYVLVRITFAFHFPLTLIIISINKYQTTLNFFQWELSGGRHASHLMNSYSVRIKKILSGTNKKKYRWYIRQITRNDEWYRKRSTSLFQYRSKKKSEKSMCQHLKTNH